MLYFLQRFDSCFYLLKATFYNAYIYRYVGPLSWPLSWPKSLLILLKDAMSARDLYWFWQDYFNRHMLAWIFTRSFWVVNIVTGWPGSILVIVGLFERTQDGLDLTLLSFNKFIVAFADLALIIILD
jgi:hypothetical protein